MLSPRILLTARPTKFRSLVLIAAVFFVVVGMGFNRPTIVNSQQGEITVNGVVQAPPPTQAPVFTSPANNTTVATIPTTVKGTCLAGTIVEVYRNSVFAGSVACTSDGKFSIQIDLFLGANTLIAKLKDSLSQYGPDSEPLKVNYKPSASRPSTAPTLPKGDVAQLVLLIDSSYQGIFPGDRATIKPQILGGTAPYAIEVDWGDGTQSLIARQGNGYFTTSHYYSKPGTYKVTVTASDKSGQRAHVQTVIIVNGKPASQDPGQTSATTGQETNIGFWQTTTGTILFWLFFILIVLTSYMVGRRHGRKKQRKLDRIPN